LLTIGHSTLPVEDFICTLQNHGAIWIADVRTVPRSRHNPQFNRDTLPLTLEAAGIGYTWLPALGGLRRPKPDSLNIGWRNLSFRGYADYMQTPGFQDGLAELFKIPGTRAVTLMCAEAVPWRCHRSLIADALLVRGLPVEHIMGPRTRNAHKLTPWTRVDGTTITYPLAVA